MPLRPITHTFNFVDAAPTHLAGAARHRLQRLLPLQRPCLSEDVMRIIGICSPCGHGSLVQPLRAFARRFALGGTNCLCLQPGLSIWSIRMTLVADAGLQRRVPPRAAGRGCAQWQPLSNQDRCSCEPRMAIYALQAAFLCLHDVNLFMFPQIWMSIHSFTNMSIKNLQFSTLTKYIKCTKCNELSALSDLG